MTYRCWVRCLGERATATVFPAWVLSPRMSPSPRHRSGAVLVLLLACVVPRSVVGVGGGADLASAGTPYLSHDRARIAAPSDCGRSVSGSAVVSFMTLARPPR